MANYPSFPSSLFDLYFAFLGSGNFSVVFTGTYARSLDNKFRVLLPKRLRSAMVAGEGLYLTPGTDQCLELHTDKSLNDLAERTRSSQASAQSLKSFSRLFYARASFCELDKQGRIRIPSESAELAGLKKDIVFVGVGFHWEVWDLSQWNSFLDQQDGAFDSVAHEMLSPAKVAPHNTIQTPVGEPTKPR